MIVSVAIVDGPVTPPRDVRIDGAGAVVEFAGIVRELEDGRPLHALHYQTYEPMAQNMLEAIARELAEAHHLLAVHVLHSRGEVGVGQCSLHLLIAAAHRKAAFAGVDAFIDRLKQDVPIWKKPVWAEQRV